jgi:hypothetical protein
MRYQEPKKSRRTYQKDCKENNDYVMSDEYVSDTDLFHPDIDPVHSPPSDDTPYISDNTAFMHWSTELEQVHDVIDGNFLKRNRHRVGDINKFLPLANIKTWQQLQLFRLRRMNMTMACDAGLDNLADETMLDNLADYNTSRGIDGFYQNALITTKREILDKSRQQEKKGFLRQLVQGKQAEESAEFMGGE